MWETFAISLLVKLAAVASIASVLARSNTFKTSLMRESRTLGQRLALAVWLAVVFGGGVAARLLSRSTYHGAYHGADLGLEGSLLAGLIGGYVSGLSAG